MITEYNDPGKLDKKTHLKCSVLSITRLLELDKLKEETRGDNESREKSLDNTRNS